jgi:hypothetical protein
VEAVSAPTKDGRTLKDFIQGGDVDVGEILLIVDEGSLGNGASKNVMHRADR